MTSRFDKHNDTKLLLAVAALVVGGAVGLTLVVGLRGEEPARSPVVRAQPIAQPEPSPARINADRGTSEIEAKVTGTVDLETARRAESVVEPPVLSDPEIRIDPDADPQQEGLRSWQAGDFGRAAAYFVAAAEAEPDRAYTWYMLGLSRWKAGDLDGAVEAMERSVDRNDASIRAYVNLARIHNDRGSHDAALDAAERALEIDEASTIALYQQARSLYNLGRVDAAVAILERCTAQAADYGQAHNLLGLIRLQREDWSGAVTALEQAARNEPDRAYVHNNLGLALERSGRVAEARVAFRRAVEIGGNPRAEVNLARLEPLQPAIDGLPTEAVAQAQPIEEPGSGEPQAAQSVTDLPVESATPGEGATD